MFNTFGKPFVLVKFGVSFQNSWDMGPNSACLILSIYVMLLVLQALGFVSTLERAS